ncbi:MAG TPA: hypothetical protein V6D50_15105 [Chroococcales cyanobacterium]
MPCCCCSSEELRSRLDQGKSLFAIATSTFHCFMPGLQLVTTHQLW